MHWHRRLPHWVPEDAAIFVTWRIAGSLPLPAPAGPRYLLQPRIAAIVSSALEHGETTRRSYDLFAWVIMPNHVHVIMTPLIPLPEIMRWLKSATATRANLILGRTGCPFWQREYFDRWIRTEKQLGLAIAYIEDNPVRSGLAECPEAWRWSSAYQNTGDKIASATSVVAGNAPPATPQLNQYPPRPK